MPRLAARLIEGEKVKVSPAIYAALVDLLFQNSASMFLGTLCAGVAALMTAVKTGDPWLWPCAAFIVLAGIVRSVQMRKYDSRKASIGEAEARIWEVRYSIGSFSARRIARRLVFCHAARQQRSDRASSVHGVDDRLHGGGRRTQLRPALDRAAAHRARLRTDGARPDAAGKPLLHRPRHPARAVLCGLAQDQHQPARHLRQPSDLPRARIQHRPPVRHRAQQHAARLVHVRGGWPRGRDQRSLQRHDGDRARSRIARIELARAFVGRRRHQHDLGPVRR